MLDRSVANRSGQGRSGGELGQVACECPDHFSGASPGDTSALLDALVSERSSCSVCQRGCVPASTRSTCITFRIYESGISHCTHCCCCEPCGISIFSIYCCPVRCCYGCTCSAAQACVNYGNGCAREIAGRIQSPGGFNSGRGDKITDTASKA